VLRVVVKSSSSLIVSRAALRDVGCTAYLLRLCDERDIFMHFSHLRNQMNTGNAKCLPKGVSDAEASLSRSKFIVPGTILLDIAVHRFVHSLSNTTAATLPVEQQFQRSSIRMLQY
jgi:hypothetical protein